MRRLSLLLGLGLLLACAEVPPSPAPAGPAAPRVGDVARQIDALLATADPRCQVGILVRSLEDGRTLYARNGSVLARPASTLKLVTAGAVARRGHLDRSVETALVAVEGGDWVLRGGGDPFLSAADLEGLAEAAAAAGERLGGALLADARLFAGARFGEGWMWDDEPAAFMPHLSALAVDGATVEVVVTGSEPGVPPRVEITPGDRWIRRELRPAARAAITRDWQNNTNLVRIRGNPGPGKTLRRRITVVEPDLHAARALRDALVVRGLASEETPVRRVEGAVGAGRPIARVVRPVEEIVHRTLVESDNLGAECLLRLLAVWEGAPRGTAAGGLETVAAWLSGIGFEADDWRMVDGSGVSHYDFLAPDVLVGLLTDLHQSPEVGDRFRACLPAAGRDGTLRRRLVGTPAEGRVRAKTGTLSGVSCLAGYAASADGEPLAFAIMNEGFVGSSAPWRSLQDGICDLLVRTPTRDEGTR